MPFKLPPSKLKIIFIFKNGQINEMNSQSISEILSARIIDLDGLKDLTFNFGCPDSGSDRALCWRLLLGALPKNRTEWSETLLTQRENYKMFVNDFVIKSEQEKSSESCDPLR